MLAADDELQQGQRPMLAEMGQTTGIIVRNIEIGVSEEDLAVDGRKDSGEKERPIYVATSADACFSFFGIK